MGTFPPPLPIAMLIPYEQLEADTLTRLIEDFVTRDGTDNGDDTPLETRVLRVRQALARKQAFILFDFESEQCSCWPGMMCRRNCWHPRPRFRLLLLDPVVHLHPVHIDIARCADAEANLAILDRHHLDADVVSDENHLTHFTSDYQHAPILQP
jgi:uncharacterized protein YheU (UPF0270 family)